MENMYIKYIAFDLDGTILNSKDVFYKGVLSGIQKLVSNGLTPIIVTGRSIKSLHSLNIKSNILHLFDENIICHNGNVIYNNRNQLISVINSLDCNINDGFYKYLANYNYIIETPYNLYASSKNAAISYSLIYKIPISIINITTNPIGISSVQKIILLNCDKVEVPNTICSHLNLRRIKYLNALEITDDSTSKYQGLNYYFRHLIKDANFENCVAIGNDYNDCEIFEKSALGIAVSNSTDEAISSADVYLQRDIATFMTSSLYKINKIGKSDLY